MSTENRKFSREKSEINDAFQLICSDLKHGHVSLYGKLNWKSENSEEVISGTFKLVNKKKSPKYVLKNVLWCKDQDRLEFHITIDEDNSTKEQIFYRNFRDPFEIKEGDAVKLIWRVNDNIYETPKAGCEKINSGNDTPDDKDGSILIGERP